VDAKIYSQGAKIFAASCKNYRLCVNFIGQWGKIIITVMEFAHALGLSKCLYII
jgi:hypothetical protein